MKQTGLLIIITAILSCIQANAQMARLYTSASGLANSQINHINQDSRGFIWISTENGLTRFDGMSFSTFNFDRTRTNSIASNLVLLTFEDSGGTFWVGTSAGLQIFDTEYNTFKTVNLGDPDIPDSDQHISSIIEIDYKGKRKILAATSGHGVYVLDRETHEIGQELQYDINAALPSQFILRIYMDSSERLWAASDEGGISIIDMKTGKRVNDIWEEGTEEIYDDILVYSFEEDRKTGNTLIGSFNHGILIFDRATGKIRKPHGITSDSDSRRIMTILRNNIAPQYGENTYITGIENGGFRMFDAEEETLSEVSFPNVPYHTDRWKVHALMEDNQGNLWIGAFQTGVMVIPKSMYGFDYTRFGNDNTLNDISSCVTSVITDGKNGGIWVGTDGDGVFHVDRYGRQTNLNEENSSLTNNSIMDLEFDGEGRLWIATYLDGIFTYSKKEGVRRFADHRHLNSNKVVSLAYSREENTMYAGTHGNGFIVIDAQTQKIQRTWADDDNKWISSLHLDSDGLLWVGTYNGPMAYDNRIRRLITYNIDESLTTRVNAFCEGSVGKIWIGTGEGLVCFDRKSRQTITYSENDGLPSNAITNILAANDGSLWISTLNGLSRFDPVSEEFKNYYQYDGLQENEFHSRAAYKADDGKMHFGGINGLTSFYPHIVDQRSHPVPPISLSRLTVLNENIEYDPEKGGDNILDKHITEASRITLPYDARFFSLEFSVLEYTNPQKISISYMMEGFEKEWKQNTSESRTMTYTNLPYGRYTMKVKAFFDGEPESFSSRDISIRILPPWYLSIWACFIYVAASLTAVLLVVYFFRKRKAHKAEKEESEIKELKLQMFTNISHEIRTPLTLVMTPLKNMREAEKDPKQKELYNLMYRNSLRILRLVNQLLDMRKVDSGQMQLHFLETDVVYFIKDIMKSFDNLAVSRSIRFSIRSYQDVLNLWIDQGNFDKIIFNILSNAFKYTPDGGDISITISGPVANKDILGDDIKEYVEFIIENSGSRVEEAHLDKLFDRFFQSDIRDAKVGSGVGLNLAKMLVELHHGEIKAYNTEEGVAFRVRIPVGNSHLSEMEMTKPTNHKDLYTKNLAAQEEHSASREDVTWSPSEEKETDGRKQKSRKRIVLVDDDSEMRAYLKLELQSIYNVEVFASGKEAWSVISTSVPDAVVTDLMMEKMDGAELCGKIKKNPGTNHIPVILLTSSADEVSQQRCIDSGADRYFTKPISLEILKSAIANAISTRETIRNKFSSDIDYGYGDVQMSDNSKQLAAKVIGVIKANIENTEFSVEDLSKEVGMSRVHLNRKLKEIMNISPSNLIRSVRLKQAAYLLANNKVNISEVAYRVGFSTHSYFSNSFHDYFGMTPKEFVAKYMDGNERESLNKLFEQV